MGYLSFDASTKIHASGRYTSTKTSKSGSGGISGFIAHIDRSTAKKEGCEWNHSNENINPDLTLENQSFYKDENGEWQETSHSKDMVDAINRRIEYAKSHGARISTKGKNDTVIVRPLVVQLDRDSITEHEETWMWDVIEILESGQFEKDNITGFSVHKDETSWHMHICFTPVYETEKNGKIKCSINQTKFFKNPRQLASIHKSIRKKLLDKGYDIEQDNKPIDEQLAGYYDKNGEWHQQGLTPAMLQQLSDKEIQLRLEMIKMRIKEEDLEMLEKNMREMDKNNKARQAEFKRERDAFLLEKSSFDNDKENLQSKEYALLIKEMEVMKKEEDAENVKREAENTKKDAENSQKEAEEIIEICKQIIREKKQAYADFMKFLEKESKRLNKPIKENVRYWCDKFRDKRFEENSREGMQIRRERMKNRDTKNTFNGSNTDYGISF